MNPTRIFISLAAALTALPAFSHIEPDKSQHHSLHTLVHDADEEKVHSILDNNSPQEFHHPGPRFAIVGKDEKFYLSISGYVKATASYDFGSVIDNPNEFVTAAIPTPGDPMNKGLFQFSAMQSHLNLNFVALPGTSNQVGAFLGMTFLDNYTPSLEFAYLKYRGLEAGYDYSLFSDPSAAAPTIDYEGPNASTAIQVGTVNYTFLFGKKKEWSAGAGLEMPVFSATNASRTAGIYQRVPDIPAFISYSWNEGTGWVRFSAILRNLFYHDMTSEKTVDKPGYGVMISGSSEICPRLTGFWQALYGNGIASRIQDLDGEGLDMVPDPSDPSRLNPVKAWGAFAGLQYNFSDNVFATASYSHVRTYAKTFADGAADTTPWGDMYRWAQYVTGNLFWNITSNIQTGVEYIYGRRMNYDGTQAHDNRLQCMIQLSF